MSLRAAWTALFSRRSSIAGPPRGRPKAPPRPRGLPEIAVDAPMPPAKPFRPNVWAPVEEGGTIYVEHSSPPVKPALRIEVTGLDEMRDRIEALLVQLDELEARLAECEETCA